MATWHQLKAKPQPRLWHPTQWTVVMDPPNDMRMLVTYSTKDAAEVYMRNLKHNNPRVYQHSYILKPGGGYA